MSRIQMLPHLFLFVGVLMLTAPYSVLSEETEQPIEDDSECVKIMKEAERNFKNCMRPHISPEDHQEALARYNGTFCPECFLICREADYFKDCLNTNLGQIISCNERIRHIPQSFFMDILDSTIDYACANDSAIMSDLMSPKIRDCEKKVVVCDDKPLGSFFMEVPDDALPEGVRFTEKGFCSVLVQSLECAGMMLEDCSETVTQTFNSVADHIKNTDSCREFFHEEIV